MIIRYTRPYFLVYGERATCVQGTVKKIKISKHIKPLFNVRVCIMYTHNPSRIMDHTGDNKVHTFLCLNFTDNVLSACREMSKKYSLIYTDAERVCCDVFF